MYVCKHTVWYGTVRKPKYDGDLGRPTYPLSSQRGPSESYRLHHSMQKPKYGHDPQKGLNTKTG